MKRLFLLALLFAGLSSNLLHAQGEGVPDLSFNSAGYWVKDFGFNDNLNKVFIQSDNKIVVTGVALSSAFQGELIVVRLNPDGTPDASFGTGGVFTYTSPAESYGYEIYELPTGELLIGGISISLNTGYADILLLRLKSDGTLDTDFGNGGSVVHSFTNFDDFLQGMDVQADGKIVVSGTVSDISGFDIFNTPAIMRFSADGEVDTSFGTDGVTRFPAVAIDNELNACRVLPDGKIVAAGHYMNAFTGATDFDILVVKVDDQGIPDAGFGTDGKVTTAIYGGIDDAFGMDIDAEGRIVVGGFTTQPVTLSFDLAILRYMPDGELDTNFGENGFVLYDNTPYDVCNDLAIQPDGKIVAVGGTGDFLFPKKFAVWRYLNDGSTDTSFGTDGLATLEIFQDSNHEFNSVALQPDGKIVAAGKALDLNNEVVVARFDVHTSATQQPATQAPAEWVYPNPTGGNVRFQLPAQSNWNASTIRIYDMQGKQRAVFPVNSMRTDVDLKVEPGMYTYRIFTSEQVFFGKLLVTTQD
ncbi:MAG: T9SS type A sorting domain-containing protein [Saprospiraceae bacterium]|nr:T9SS type A sorting domain-containing protein [Saprospiraceae bacterium]